jgi:hypothetical protein
MPATTPRPRPVTARQLERSILRYLLAHRDARDSADGIRHWWLPPRQRGVSAVEVRHALRALARRGWVSSAGRGRYTAYGLEARRAAEARAFLEEDA